jgi:hypothetical protein
MTAAAAATARARDVTRLESGIFFRFCFLYYITLMFFLGQLNALKRPWQQQQQ